LYLGLCNRIKINYDDEDDNVRLAYNGFTVPLNIKASVNWDICC